MIGIVVVTHGRLAEELVNAARQIVGEVPAIAAVSLGWGDDVAAAREAIERGLAEAGGEALVLTDMFGGTPTNLSLPFLSEKVEIVTGVSLPMLIKAVSPARGAPGRGGPGGAGPGQGRHLRGQRDPREEACLTRRDVRISNRLGLHARAAARFVHTANRFRARISAIRDGRVMDGKSILGILLLAASQGSTLTLEADGEDEEEALEALARLVEGGFGEEP